MKANVKQSVLAVGALLAITFAFEATAAEQKIEAAPSAWSIVPSIGASSFSLKGSDFNSGTSGMTVGALAYWDTGVEKLDLEFGSEYVQAGGKAGNWLISVNQKLDYITAPIGVRYRAAKYGNAEQNIFSLRGGLTPALLMSAKVEGGGMLDGYDGGSNKDDFKSSTFLAYVGAGGTYDMGSNQAITYDFRYTTGLTKADKANTATNDGYIMSVGYSIPL